MFIDLFGFYFNHIGAHTGIYPDSFVKIRLYLAEILRISKLDWCDGGGKEKGRGEEGKGRRRGGIVLCNSLIILEHPQEYTLKIL